MNLRFTVQNGRRGNDDDDDDDYDRPIPAAPKKQPARRFTKGWFGGKKEEKSVGTRVREAVIEDKKKMGGSEEWNKRKRELEKREEERMVRVREEEE